MSIFLLLWDVETLIELCLQQLAKGVYASNSKG